MEVEVLIELVGFGVADNVDVEAQVQAEVELNKNKNKKKCNRRPEYLRLPTRKENTIVN